MENEMKFRLAVAKKTIEAIKKRPTKRIKVSILKEHYDWFQEYAKTLNISLDDYLMIFFYQKSKEARIKYIREGEQRLARNN